MASYRGGEQNRHHSTQGLDVMGAKKPGFFESLFWLGLALLFIHALLEGIGRWIRYGEP